MTSPQKRKGAKYELDVVGYLRQSGYRVDRTRVGWSDDRGDIHGIVRTHDGIVGRASDGNHHEKPFVIECKNQRRDCLPDWIKQLKEETSNANTDVGAVVHKKHGVTDAAEQYATMPLYMLVTLLKEAGYAVHEEDSATD